MTTTTTALRRARPLSLLCLSTLLGGSMCPRQDTVETPLTVTDADPATQVVNADTSFTLTFSADLDVASISADTVVLMLTEDVSNALMSDLGSPPLSMSRRDQVISATVNLSGQRVVVNPDQELPAGVDVSLLVSKAVKSRAGKTLVSALGESENFRLDFTVRDAPPTVVGTTLPTGSPALVPPNLRSLGLTFSGPIQGASASAVRVQKQDGSQTVEVESAVVQLDARTLHVRLKDGACQPLCPQTDYQVSVGEPLTGTQGQTITPFQQVFRTLADADLEGPTLRRVPTQQSSEADVRLSFVTQEPGAGRLRVGAPGGPYDLQFEAVALAPCTGFQAARECTYAAVATGLDLGVDGTGRTYGGMLELTDDFGNTHVFGEFVLRTVVLPKLRISEVYNNPPGASADEKTSEFVELANISTSATYDLSRMVLATLDRTTGAVSSSMTLRALGASSLLAPGKFAVLGGSQFDPSSVQTAADAVVMVDAVSSRSTLLGGLSASASSAKPLALFDGDPAQGAPLVTLFQPPLELYAPSSTFPEGVSAERLMLTSADDAAVWCQSQAGPSPGLTNSVDGLAACP